MFRRFFRMTSRIKNKLLLLALYIRNIYLLFHQKRYFATGKSHVSLKMNKHNISFVRFCLYLYAKNADVRIMSNFDYDKKK